MIYCRNAHNTLWSIIPKVHRNYTDRYRAVGIMLPCFDDVDLKYFKEAPP